MKRVFLEYLRRRSKRLRGLTDGEDFPDVHALTPPESAEVKDAARVVRSLLGMLGPEERGIIVGLHYWDMNGRELAEFLCVPRTTLLDRYKYAMNTLRHWLTERGLAPQGNDDEPDRRGSF